MNSFWDDLKDFLGGKALIALLIAIIGLITGIVIGVPRSESETSDTTFSLHGGVEFERKTEHQRQEGGSSAQQTTTGSPTSIPVVAGEGNTPNRAGSNQSSSSQHIGGNWVSGNSTMRYEINDHGSSVDVHGYDAMRGQNVFVGTGYLNGRELVIPRFYSFLDDTYGTVKLSMSEDGNTLQGDFEGINPTQEHKVVLLRIP